jgi:hypothetical protein
LTTGCAYYPHLTGIPLIKEKGDTRIEGGVAFYSPSAHISISQGVTEKIAYQAAVSIGAVSKEYYTQGALGYYKNIGARTVFESYGGFGFGYGDAYKDANPGDLTGNYQIYFAQFNIGNVTRKFANIEYGLGLKSGYFHSKMTDQSFFSLPEDYPQNQPYPVYSLNGIIVEPTVFTRLGGKNLKFIVEYGICEMIQLTHNDKKFPVGDNFGIGFSYSFGGNSKSKQK